MIVGPPSRGYANGSIVVVHGAIRRSVTFSAISRSRARATPASALLLSQLMELIGVGPGKARATGTVAKSMVTSSTAIVIPIAAFL